MPYSSKSGTSIGSSVSYSGAGADGIGIGIDIVLRIKFLKRRGYIGQHIKKMVFRDINPLSLRGLRLTQCDVKGVGRNPRPSNRKRECRCKDGHERLLQRGGLPGTSGSDGQFNILVHEGLASASGQPRNRRRCASCTPPTSSSQASPQDPTSCMACNASPLAAGGGASDSSRKGPAREFRHPFSLRQRRWTCATFTLMACLLFADQNLLSPNVRQTHFPTFHYALI